MIGIIIVLAICMVLPALIIGYASESPLLALIIYVILMIVACPISTTHTETGTYEIERIEDIADGYSIFYTDNGTIRVEEIKEEDVDILAYSSGNETIMYLEKKYYTSLTGIIYLEENARISIGN